MRRVGVCGGLVCAALIGLSGPSRAVVTMTVSIHQTSDDSTVDHIQFPAVTVPAGWVIANDYIQLDTQMTDTGDGIQIYTDNTSADASPKYTGIISPTTQTPAGLIDLSATDQKLPTAWSIVNPVNSPGVVPPALDPNNGGFQWFFHDDKAQVTNNQGALFFQNGDPYMTVVNQNCIGVNPTTPCIHYGQSPFQFGAGPTPNRIFIEANFQNAMGGDTYRTTAIRIEAFTQ